jgi:very-short-patch-repair endonuclease
MKIYYNPKRKALSRELRKKSTLSEVLLWKIVKGEKKTQPPVSPFVKGD